MPSPRPTRLEIFITNRCNLRCTYCSSRHITAAAGRTLSLDGLKRAVDIFASYGAAGGQLEDRTICFTGGEPLLEFPLLKKIIGYIRGRRERFAVTVNTNATLLTREKAAFLLANDIYLAVSLDGAKPVHDLHRIFKDDRGASVYDALFKNLKALPPAFLKNVRASVTITSRTMPSIIDTVGLLQDMGFRFVELGLDSYETWTPGKLRILEKTLSAVRRHYVGLLRSGNFREMNRVFTFSLENKQQKAGFYTPMSDISLSPDGLFYPCDTLATAAAGSRDFVIGDLEKGIDFARLKSIYRRAAAGIPADKRVEGAFSPVDRYLYCKVHGRDPGAMLEDAAEANRIFAEKIGGFLEIQRVWRELAKNKGFGDLEHAPKYRGARPVRGLAIDLGAGGQSGRTLPGLRPAVDYFLYAGPGRKALAVGGAGGPAAFETVEALAAYGLLKAGLLGKKLRFTVETGPL